MDSIFNGSVGVQGQASVAGAFSYNLQMQSYLTQAQAYVTQVPSLLRSFWGNLTSATYSGASGTENALSDGYAIGTGTLYQGLSYGVEGSRALPRVGMFVGSALDGVKGINNLANGSYIEAIINSASIEGGIVFGDLGEVVGSALGGGFPNPLAIGLGSLFSGLGAAGGSRLFTAVAQTALGYTNGRPSGESGGVVAPGIAYSGGNSNFWAGSTDLGVASLQSGQPSILNPSPTGVSFTQPDLGWAYPAANLTPSSPDGFPGLNFPLPTYDLPLPDLSLTEIPDSPPTPPNIGFLFPDLGNFGDYGDLGDFDFGPVILNLDGRGLNLDTLSSSTQFIDTDGGENKHRTAWAAKGNGVLALDLYGDGQIHQKNQYAFTEWDPTATSDLQALKDVFDTNHNGKLDAGDANWAQFKVVVNGQMVSLDSLGITSIDLTPTGSGQTFADGSAFTGTASYTKSDGTQGQVGDAVLATDDHGYLIHQTRTTDAGGSVTTDIVGSNADGSTAFENVATISADGLTRTISYDDNGDGVFDRSQSTVTAANADGSLTQTTSDFNADGSLKDRTSTTTNTDSKTVTTLVDQNGDGVWDQSEVFVSNADGSTSTTTKNLAANGAIVNQTQVSTSTDGLTKTTKVDNTGSGTFDHVKTDTTVVNADGSRVETVTDAGSNGTVLDRTVTSTSADGRSKTVSMDHTGSGSFDLVTTSSITINADRSVTTVIQEKNADGSLRDSSTTTLSADGLSKTVSSDLNGDGSIDQIVSDVNFTGPHGVHTDTVTNESGNSTLLSQTVTRTNLTHVTDGSSTGTTVINANGQDVSGDYRTMYINDDGSTVVVVANVSPASGKLIRSTTTRVESGGLSKTISTDSDGDGTNDLVTTDTIVVNTDGSRTETVTDTSANGTLIDKSITATSANSLTQTKSQDLNGDGTVDQTTTDAIVLNADGSRTETVSVTSGINALLSKSITTTSADRKTTTKTIDSNGDGHVDETQLTVLGSDGATTRTVTDTSANGALETKSVSTVSANGLSRTTQIDTSGEGAFDLSTTDVTIMNADGSKTDTQSRLSGNGTLLSKVVVTTSGNGLVVTTGTDVNGDGVLDSKTTDSTTLNADGSKTETVSDYTGDGAKLIDQTITLTAASGLLKTVSQDTDGDGTIDSVRSDITTLNADGSKSETLSERSANGTLLDQTIINTNADGQTIDRHHSDMSANGGKTSSAITISSDGTRTEVVSTYASDGSTLRSSTTTITSANGLTTSSKTDLNGDGAIDQSSSSATTLNADGTKTVTTSDFNADGSLKDSLATTTSANGLSTSTQVSVVGTGPIRLVHRTIVDESGSFTRASTDVKTINADGSTTEVVTAMNPLGAQIPFSLAPNPDGSLHAKTTIIVSADKKVTTVSKDINGDGVTDQLITTTINADGSDVTVASDLQADGLTPKDQKVTTTNATGLTKSTARYTNSADAVRQSEIYRLYEAILGRAPDASGLQSNIAALAAGATIAAIAAALINSDEFRQKYGSPSDSQFVTLLYQNALGRSPDAGGLASWMGSLQGGGLDSRAAVAVGIADSDEGHRHTAISELTWAGTNASFTQAGSLQDSDAVVVNQDGSTTETRFDAANDKTVVATSADGLTVTKTYSTADGNSSQATRTVLNADGSKTTTASTYDSGTLESQSATTVEANGLVQKTILKTDFDSANNSTTSEADDTTVLNADGTTTRTVTDTSAGIPIFKSVTTKSADGLTVSTQRDTTGSGSFDQAETTQTQLLADGSSAVSTSEFNSDGSLKDKSVTTTSADGRLVTITQDANGDGIIDRSETMTKLVDGSSSDVITYYNASGAESGRSTRNISFDGLSEVTTSNHANGTDQGRIVTKAMDALGATSVTTQDFDYMVGGNGFGTEPVIRMQGGAISVSRLRQVSTTQTSADGKTTTVSIDANADGSVDQTTSSVTAVDGSITITTTNDGVARASGLPSGRVAWISATTAKESMPASTVTKISADGLTKTVKADYDGDGADEHSETWKKQIDGSWAATMTDSNTNSVVTARGTESISADGRTTTLKEDSRNTGLIDHSDVSVVGLDGSVKETVTDLNSDGSLKSSSVTTVDASGNHQHIVRNDGTSTDIFNHGGIDLADGDGVAVDQINSRYDYDAQGRLTQVRFGYTDGTAVEKDYSTDPSKPSMVKTSFDALGKPRSQATHNRDGTVTVVTLGAPGDPSVVKTQQSFNAEGALTEQVDYFADNSYRDVKINPDPANAQTWSKLTTWVQSDQKTVTHQQWVYPDGTRVEVYPQGIHSVTGGGDPAAVLTQQKFDAQGRQVLERDNFSDGSHSESQWDAAGTQSWSSVSTWFNAQGQQTRQLISNHDGTSADVTNTYNAQGQTTHQTIVRQDGSRIEIYPQGQFKATGSGDFLAGFTQQSFDAQGRLLAERDDIGFGSRVEVAYNYDPAAYIKKQVTYFLPTGVAQYRITWDRGNIERIDALDLSYYSAPIKDSYPLFNSAAPVVLDLANKGTKDMLTPLSSASETFDMAGDGQQHRTAWASAGEGVLAIDADGSGQIDQRKDVVFTDWAPGATSDMQALREVFDTNHDGKLDAGDVRWKDFRVLIDGTAETLDQLGIASIELTPQGASTWFSDGSSINGTSVFTRTDGSTGLAGDASFRYDPSAASSNGGPASGSVQVQASTQLNQLIGAMASFAPPASAETALAAANAAQLRAAPLLAAAH